MKAIITNLSPSELFARAVDNARRASNAIDELTESSLDEGETVTDRAVLVARHAMVLSEAFSIIDSLAYGELHDCVAPSRVEPVTDNPNAN
jgi:hypothetical protein